MDLKVMPAPDDVSRNRVAALMRGYSTEITTRDPSPERTCAVALPRGTEVYIAFIPGASHDHVLSVAAILEKAGYVAIPHVAARSFLSYTQLTTFLGRLRRAGVDNVLLVGGDMDKPAGPFASSLDVLQTGVIESHGFLRAGLCCYPEPHRKIDQGKLDQALTAKLAILKQQHVAPWLVSQFCLEAEPIVTMVEGLRARGITAALRIGIAGPTDRRTLWKYAMRCGIGASVRALGTRIDAVRDLLIRDTPNALVSELAERLDAPRLGIDGLHIFSFGGVESSGAWANRIISDGDPASGAR